MDTQRWSATESLTEALFALKLADSCLDRQRRFEPEVAQSQIRWAHRMILEAMRGERLQIQERGAPIRSLSA